MNILADNKELLKYMEIWDKIVDLFNIKSIIKECYIITSYITNA